MSRVAARSSRAGSGELTLRREVSGFPFTLRHESPFRGSLPPVAFDLEMFAPRVRQHADEWDLLGFDWSIGPIEPNHGKAITSATFENGEWLAEILIWETGETDLGTLRLRDQQVINKHYDLVTGADLDVVIDEVLKLLRDGEIPGDAYIP